MLLSANQLMESDMIKITLEFDSYSAAAAALAHIDEQLHPPVVRTRRGTSTEEAAATEIPGVKSVNTSPPPEMSQDEVQAAIAKANADSAARRKAKPAVTVEDASPDAPEAPAFEYATLRAAVNKIGAAIAPAVARPALTGIAQQFGCDTFTQLKPDQWPEAYKACVALAQKFGVQL